MIISEVTRDEYPEIVEVWEASVRATHNFLTESDIQFFKPLILNEFLEAVNLRCVKSDDGRILGFLGVAQNNIEMLFLDPQNRGEGIGRILVHYAIEQMGVQKVDVNEQNPDAVGFYKHMGFEVTSRSPLDSMGKPFPILHMALPD
ncbi:acetyltransferase [Endozoicomonas lisbonensis]|uniref:Acetyltransferase n=1 Tax=Endozoicomonas lisbonensis TaxID=3120522 RepID=A0ABV2SN67_9GAMM